MKQDLISVIIITYNNEKYINDCIDSVINQTYKKLEIIIVNDGSTDGTSSIVERYIKEDKRIIYIDRKENKGTMFTRQEGYNKANGQYIFFIDSDDYIEKNAIEELYFDLKINKVDAIKCNFKKNVNGKILKIKNQVNEKVVLKKDEFEPVLYDLIYTSIYCNSMCGQLVKRESLKNINCVNSELIYGEDIQNNLYLFLNIYSIELCNKELYIYRCNNNSITNIVNEKKINDLFITFEKLYKFIDDAKIINKNKYKKLLAKKLYDYILIIFVQLVSSEKRKKSIERIKQIIQQSYGILKYYDSITTEYKMKTEKFDLKILLRKKYNVLYFYIKCIYLPLKKIYRKIRK